MFPGVLLAIPYIEIMRSLGLIDTLASLIITYCTFAIPLCSWILKGYFDSLPRDLEEAAMVDGCSKLGALRRIILPLSVPGVVATAIFIFIQSWGEALFAILLINTSSNYVLAVGVYTLSISEFEWSWANLLTSGVLTALPLVSIFVFLQKYLVAGLTKGAIKG
jgi:multiple sugar transport system permease protein